MRLIFVLIILVAVILAATWLSQDTSSRHGGSSKHVKNLDANPRSKSEAYVIKILEDITGAKFPTVNPPWLIWRGKTLELDGYNERLGVALEFSGPLHTKWTPSYESYSRYISRVIKDMVKVRACAKRGVGLIVVDQSLPREHVRAYLESRLHDLGKMPPPVRYIREQIAEPYRNPQLEAELGIDGELAALSKIK